MLCSCEVVFDQVLLNSYGVNKSVFEEKFPSSLLTKLNGMGQSDQRKNSPVWKTKTQKCLM